MKTHRDLKVWQGSIELAVEIYKLVSTFPQEEKFGLSHQIRKAAISVPSNIAEGAARNSNREYKQFLYISLGSLSELETQLMISELLCYCENDEIPFEKVKIIRMQLCKLISFLKQKELTQ